MLLSWLFTVLPFALASTIPASDDLHPRCWPDHVGAIATTWAACKIIIDGLTHNEDPNVPKLFGKRGVRGSDYVLPTSFLRRGSNCLVGVDFRPETRGDRDFVALSTLQRTARTLALVCVISPPHLGGRVEIGFNERLLLHVSGIDLPVLNETAVLPNNTYEIF